MNRAELGATLANIRKAQGITIRQLAKLTATSTRAVQAVEKGWYNVGIDAYLTMAEKLGAEVQIKSQQ